uniref:peroxidase n=1 Tax=Kalanchoe fedtschenkoi TaxID=63787 RepID=A0A7N0TPV7_KALFE
MAVIKLLSLIVIFQLVVAASAASSPLKVGYYKKSCPGLENIVKRSTAKFILRDRTLAAPLLRMHFHDCFVRGCDASVLLNSTSTNQAERDAIPNLSLRGFDVIDAAKEALERECPGVVSCADVLALVTRDAVSLIYGPYWEVPVGRRDGNQSIAFEALTNLPSPFANISTLITMFGNKGLNVKDLVVLSGGHTLGISHCTSFTNRLYNFTGKGDSDPTLDPNYVVQLKKKCKPGDTTSFVSLDRTATRFDEDYYTSVAKRRGLLQSDAALLDNQQTRNY